MDERENESLAAGGPRREAGPYTGPGDEEQDTLNGQVAATIRGLDRKLTDGLNLVHGQLDVMRQERIEDRRELRETRAELKAEIAAVDARAEQRAKELGDRLTAMERGVQGRFTAMEQKVESRFDAIEAKFESRFASLEEAIRELTALTNTALERTLGTRRLVRGVLGAVALLLAGGLLRPVFERAVQALLGG